MNFEQTDYLFAFVILHYCAIEETVKCVDSIKNMAQKANYMIIIVDNASPNNTGLVLKEKYAHDKYCTVILNQENLGFARGNNVGFQYAKKHGADFICMMNSDTYLLDEEFVQQSISDYLETKYYVLGPNIYNPDCHQSNPIRGGHALTFQESKKKILSLRIQIIFCQLGLYRIMQIIRSLKLTGKKRLNNITSGIRITKTLSFRAVAGYFLLCI